MKKYFTKIRPFDFKLFDGEGSGGEVGVGAEGDQAGAQPRQAAEDQKKTGEEQNVIYGKQESKALQSDAGTDDTDAAESKPAPEDLRQKYDEFMKDEAMKKFYAQDTQKIINRRFRDSKAREEQLNTALSSQNELIDKLYQRYGVNDLNSLSAAIDNDSSYWEDAAAEAGMTVEQFKNYRKMERETKKYRQMLENNRREQMVRQQYATWVGEASEVKKAYPDFDLDKELLNPDFRGLIAQKNPQYAISMKQAYELCHLNDIKESIKSEASQATEQNVVNNIRARGKRPVEGAVQGQGGVIVKDDVSKLTKKDRAEIAKRVLRGETITF